jgi:hypothetical protein
MGIAWLVFRENVDRRLLFGAFAILTGAALLSWQGSASFSWGAALIVAACVSWGIGLSGIRVLAGHNGKEGAPPMARRKEPAISAAILEQLLAGADAKTAFDQGGLLDSLKKALTERALNAELDHHLDGEGGFGNGRNGYGRKTVTTETGKLELEIPRDRQSSFDPQLIAKLILPRMSGHLV